MTVYSTKAPGVYLEEISGTPPISGVGTATASFVGFASRGPTTPTLVTNWTQFEETFGGLTVGAALGHAVYGYLANGGSSCFVVRVGGGDDGGATSATATLLSADGDDALTVTAAIPGDAGNGISIEVRSSAPPVSAPTGGRSGTSDDDAEEADDPGSASPPPAPSPSPTLDLVVHGPDGRDETYAGVTPQTLLSQLATSSLVTAVTPAGGKVLRPTDGTTSLAGGSPGAPVSADAFLGEEEAGTGLAGLSRVDEVTMVAAPDLVTLHRSGAMSAADVEVVQTAIVDVCDALGDRMAILDPPFATAGGGSMTPQQAAEWVGGLPGSKFLTVYYPWVLVHDPVTRQVVSVPPSGHVAGVWARNDAQFGVGHAPVGRLRGTVGLERVLNDAEQGVLNPLGLNCLRELAGMGTCVWGARTRATVDAEWRYVNVRRLFNYIEESVVEGTRFAIFEPNDQDLWKRLHRSVSSFLRGFWQDGGLAGATAEQAFYVRCDAETNPPDRVDQGIVTVEIGAAPVKPAEFVVLRFSQLTDSARAVP